MHIAVRPALFACAIPCLLAGLATPAAAQAEARVSGFFTLGALSTPEYQGSSDRTVSPLVAARLAYGQYYIETATLSASIALRANVSPWPGIEFGPILGQRRGRSDVENARVKLLPGIDDAFEAGVFLRLPFRNLFDVRDEAAIEVQFLSDASSTDSGDLFSVGGSYRFRPTERLRLGVIAAATYASDRYNQTFFGIDAAGAAASGLPAYKAGSGIRDVGVTLTANYEIGANWGIAGVASYRQLLGDAADSPIVAREGDANQLSFGIGISYRF
jgi:outer membrane scaffolding protein for murein synthesis (MipA/OmpV family)